MCMPVEEQEPQSCVAATVVLSMKQSVSTQPVSEQTNGEEHALVFNLFVVCIYKNKTGPTA